MYGFYLIDDAALSLLSKSFNAYSEALCSNDSELFEADTVSAATRAASILIFNTSRPAMTITGDQARVAVHGSMSPEPGFFTGTAYSEIRADVQAALDNEAVSEIVLDINSPGGTTAGFSELASFLRDARSQKTITAEITGTAASAAYGVAAQANKIIALSPSNVIGSIGVAVGPAYVSENIVSARSSKAPLKMRQLSEPEGQEALQPLLDDLHAQFVDDIVAGRDKKSITVNKVNSSFGKGGVMTARQGLDVGMVDEIIPSINNITADGDDDESTSNIADSTVHNAPAQQDQLKPQSDKPPKGKVMDLDKLRAEHPALYESVMALGRTEGVTTERDRVNAHLTMGKTSGDMGTAAKYITDGSEFTSAVQAVYMAAGMNNTERLAAVADSTESLGTDETANGDADKVKALAGDIVKQLS